MKKKSSISIKEDDFLQNSIWKLCMLPRYSYTASCRHFLFGHNGWRHVKCLNLDMENEGDDTCCTVAKWMKVCTVMVAIGFWSDSAPFFISHLYPKCCLDLACGKIVIVSGDGCRSFSPFTNKNTKFIGPKDKVDLWVKHLHDKEEEAWA